MGMTLKDIRNMSLQLINQYSIAGTDIALSYNNQEDYTRRMNPLINDAQTIIATSTKPLMAQYAITQNQVPNAIAGNTYDVRQALHEKPLVYKAPKAQAFYFEADGEGLLEIRSKGEVVYTKNFKAEEKGFNTYKGIFNRSEDVELVIIADFPCNVRNVAMYDVVFKDEESVQVCAPYLAYEMPEDFYQLVGRGIPYTSGDRFCMSHEYAWIGDKTLLLKSDLIGEWKVDYNRYPTQINEKTPEDTKLDNSLDAQLAIPYFVAAHLVMFDNGNAAYSLMNEWELKLARLGESVQSTVTTIEDKYFTGINNF